MLKLKLQSGFSQYVSTVQPGLSECLHYSLDSELSECLHYSLYSELSECLRYSLDDSEVTIGLAAK